MNTVLVPGQVATKEAAETIAFKHRLALLTANPVIIADSFGVIAKHMDEKWLTGRFSSVPADCTKTHSCCEVLKR